LSEQWVLLFYSNSILRFKYFVNSVFDIIPQEGDRIMLDDMAYIIQQMFYNYDKKEIIINLEEGYFD
jgi:hypothetical protein